MRNILRSSIVSAAGTAASRVLGALRDVGITHVFGNDADPFWVAWTVPSVFRRFVADEGLTGALIPAVAQTENAEGTKAAKRLAGAALLALLLAGIIIVVVGILVAPWLVKVLAWGYNDEPENLELVIQLARWLFPFVLFVSLVSYCEALLNHRGHFFIPKIAPGLVSGCIAAGAVFVASHLEEPFLALCWGALVGGLVHLLACIPPLVIYWGAPRPSTRGFRDPRFRSFLREMGKVVAIGILAPINLILLRLLATLLEKGAVTQYWNANRVVDLAQGAVAVGVGSALLPAIAEDAVQKNWQRFRSHFNEASLLVGIALIPAAALLLALAEPIVAILFRHGKFGVESVQHTTAVLRLLVPFMLALGGINIVKKVYFALDDRTTLLWVGVCGVLVTGGGGYLLSREIGVEGLGAALSISVVVQLVIYLIVLRKKMSEKIGLAQLTGPLTRLTAAAIPAGVAAWGICNFGQWELGPASLNNWLLLVGAGICAAFIYLSLGWILGVEQLQSVLRRVARKLRRN